MPDFAESTHSAFIRSQNMMRNQPSHTWVLVFQLLRVDLEVLNIELGTVNGAQELQFIQGAFQAPLVFTPPQLPGTFLFMFGPIGPDGQLGNFLRYLIEYNGSILLPGATGASWQSQRFLTKFYFPTLGGLPDNYTSIPLTNPPGVPSTFKTSLPDFQLDASYSQETWGYPIPFGSFYKYATDATVSVLMTPNTYSSAYIIDETANPFNTAWDSSTTPPFPANSPRTVCDVGTYDVNSMNVNIEFHFEILDHTINYVTASPKSSAYPPSEAIIVLIQPSSLGIITYTVNSTGSGSGTINASFTTDSVTLASMTSRQGMAADYDTVANGGYMLPGWTPSTPTVSLGSLTFHEISLTNSAPTLGDGGGAYQQLNLGWFRVHGTTIQQIGVIDSSHGQLKTQTPHRLSVGSVISTLSTFSIGPNPVNAWDLVNLTITQIVDQYTLNFTMTTGQISQVSSHAYLNNGIVVDNIAIDIVPDSAVRAETDGLLGDYQSGVTQVMDELNALVDICYTYQWQSDINGSQFHFTMTYAGVIES